jgi:hypothetical protein
MIMMVVMDAMLLFFMVGELFKIGKANVLLL